MFKWESNLTEAERITKNVINIMSIKKNEVCFDREIGMNVDYIDKPADKISSEMVTETIDMLESREPRAEVMIEDIINFSQNGEYQMKVVVNHV